MQILRLALAFVRVSLRRQCYQFFPINTGLNGLLTVVQNTMLT